MGRWAQAKRRGGGPGLQLGPGPPPAPVLEIVGESVFVYPTGAPDDGGLFTFEQSNDNGANWDPWGTLPWSIEAYLGDVSVLEGFWYRCAEVGNGTVYAGQSAWSPTLIL